MKLPRFSADRSVRNGSGVQAGTTSRSEAQSITAMINITCLLGCGIGVLKCLPCGTNLGCWATCAGPSAIGCITRCLS
ncbi:MAG TPA: hypothetical protein VHI13_08520 [Candidatus Kapabacteria bacterium]|nr:hypothetical protein [Candidatus Kapabacteria bacterium]